jgi:hypothetical protein
MLDGVPEVDEDGPEDGSAEKDGEEAPACGAVEARDGVRAVKFAEAVFEGRALAAFAGAAEMQTLRCGVGRLDCGRWLHGGDARYNSLIRRERFH